MSNLKYNFQFINNLLILKFVDVIFCNIIKYNIIKKIKKIYKNIINKNTSIQTN